MEPANCWWQQAFESYRRGRPEAFDDETYSRYDRERKEAWERYFLPVGEGGDQEVDEDIVRRLARERFAELAR
jgi:hypothetical protein